MDYNQITSKHFYRIYKRNKKHKTDGFMLDYDELDRDLSYVIKNLHSLNLLITIVVNPLPQVIR